MIQEKQVKLFKNGVNQAIRIPKEFELDCDEALIQKDGDRLIINPVRKGKLLAILAKLEPLQETFPDVDQDLLSLDEIDL